MPRFTISIKANNIGPHENISWSGSVATNKTGIFATNGKGKSFLGRAFQYIGDAERCKDVQSADRMVTLGQNQGNFNFEIADKKSTLVFKRGAGVTRTNNYYIFHVFNNDYVAENIVKRNYGLPTEDALSGYILGKSNVDLDKQKADLKTKREHIESDLKKFKETSLQKLSEYRTEFNIGRNTDFLNLHDEIQNMDCVPQTVFKDVSQQIDKIRTDYKKLSMFPNDEEDVICYNDLQLYIQENKIRENLLKPINKINITDSTLETFVKDNKDFIIKGAELFKLNSKECPFCKSPTDKHISSILQIYNEFLRSPEKEMISFCEDQIAAAEKEIKSISDIRNNLNTTKIKYDMLKDKFVDYKHDLIITDNVFDGLKTEIYKIKQQLDNKKNEVFSTIDFDISNYVNAKNEFINEMHRIKGLVDSINSEKDKIAIQRTNLRNQVIPLIRSELLESKELEKLWNDEKDAQNLATRIKAKEDRENISAKKRYMNSLKKLLNIFFRNKYIITDDGVISFKDNDVSADFDHILSEGEKTIVAFCYYLAEIHLIVKDEQDYSKIFFIIDDPISSLDANYIYTMCQIIRNLKDYFPGIRYEKYLILTHSIEFMGMLTRNGIINNDLELIDGTISKTNKDRFRIPYLSHLRDINNVVYTRTPTHTTANSIRNILETINNFLCPGRSLEKFIKTEKDFKNTSIYTTIQDGSHGNIGNWNCLSDDELVALAEDLLTYISKSPFKGQLNSLN